MSGSALASFYCLGGALLGFWTVLRFPSLSPRSFLGAAVAFFVAGTALSVIPALLAYAVQHAGRVGAIAGLLGLVLPGATATFWSLGSLVRLFCGLPGRGAG